MTFGVAVTFMRVEFGGGDLRALGIGYIVLVIVSAMHLGVLGLTRRLTRVYGFILVGAWTMAIAAMILIEVLS